MIGTRSFLALFVALATLLGSLSGAFASTQKSVGRLQAQMSVQTKMAVPAHSQVHAVGAASVGDDCCAPEDARHANCHFDMVALLRAEPARLAPPAQRFGLVPPTQGHATPSNGFLDPPRA